MAIPNDFDYSKTWRSASDFPTVEENEVKVRDDMQCLFDEIRDALNTVAAAVKAVNVPFTPSSQLRSTNVQAAIDTLLSSFTRLDEDKADLSDGKLDPYQRSLPIVHVNANYTLTSEAQGKALMFSNSSPASLVIPPHPYDSMPVDSEVLVFRAGADVTIAPGTGVVISNPGSGLNVPYNGIVRLKKWANNLWSVEGMPVSAAQVGSNAVQTGSIVDAAVTAAKLASSSVTGPKLATDAVTATKIADGAIRTAKIADGSVTGAKLALYAVDTDNIEEKAVTKEKLADNVLTGLPVLVPYDTTTANELDLAWAAGRLPICVYSSGEAIEVAPMTAKDSNTYTFSCVNAVGRAVYTLARGTNRWLRTFTPWSSGGSGNA